MPDDMSSLGLDAILIDKLELRKNNTPVYTGTVVLRLFLGRLPLDDPDRQPMLLRIPFETSSLDHAFAYALEAASGFGDSVGETARRVLEELESRPKDNQPSQG